MRFLNMPREKMVKQKRIDEFFKSTNSSRKLDNIKKNSALSVTPRTPNKTKLKRLQHTKHAIKHLKSSQLNLDDDKDVEIISQENNTLCYEKEGVDKYISLSESNISYDPTSLCTITYDSAAELSQEELAFEKYNNDVLPINKLKKDIPNGNDSDNGVLENTPLKKQLICDKNISPIANSNSSPSTFKKSKYSPKMSSNISPNKHVARKLFDQFVNIDIVRTVIEHMNLVKQGAIVPNNFNMEEIYFSNTFEYRYSQINTKASVKYELNNVNLPSDLNAKILIGSILTVLSKPYNCSYFEENELDFIYCILTLPEKAQKLLARMIKRMRGWHRKDSINYPDISSNLKDVFDLLESRCICTYDLKDESLAAVLDLLQVKELHQLSRSMKIDCKGKKEIIVDKLIKLSRKKTLFPGMKSPSSVLYDCIFKILNCVRITDRTWNIIDIIMTLLLPNEDPQMSMSDIFFKLGDIYLGRAVFPSTPKDQFPLFSSRPHLLIYVNVKSELSTMLNLIEKGDWERVQTYGNTAMETLPNILKTELLRLENSILPMHVRKFLPGYVWLKILSKSIEAFKRKKDTAKVVDILNFLIKQNCHMNSSKGKWYCELALVKMHHDKDLDSSALITIEALGCEYLSQVDKVDLLQRADRILNRKTGVTLQTKTNINKVLNTHYHEMCTFKPASNIISAVAMPKAPQGGKSTWLIKSSDHDNNYGTVETVALYHYMEQNFPNGLHCEGNLPILLFTTLFWEELYEENIPGAFATPYAIAPSDLYTKNFYENRKHRIDIKLRFLDTFNADPASFSSWMEQRFKTYKQYQSLMPRNLLEHDIYMKEIVYCLGVQGVIGICRRMIENFKLWSAGFPDLIVWNYDTRQHKIVEVKGPKDILSTKQLLWLKYLNEIGLNTEVCHVQGMKMLHDNNKFKILELPPL
ncbi:fanconi-associated nuclease 1 isoform X1 [Megalopta genalis]|uniref:fanconi-associated nuclease 1 isoform X1 n=1 Tax=Megalopta genalis TaxID=115081 RepID=UPI003FD21D48